ncbi:hypothetical protein AB0M60_18755, partial [Micromonospora wenchangensis]
MAGRPTPADPVTGPPPAAPSTGPAVEKPAGPAPRSADPAGPGARSADPAGPGARSADPAGAGPRIADLPVGLRAAEPAAVRRHGVGVSPGPSPDPAVAAVRVAVRRALAGLPSAGPVLVACSGGADSLALAAATAFVASRLGRPAGLVTVDHGLQAGSAERAAAVAGW